MFFEVPGHKLQVCGQISPIVLKFWNPSTKNTKRSHILANSEQAPVRSICDKNWAATSLSSKQTQNKESMYKYQIIQTFINFSKVVVVNFFTHGKYPKWFQRWQHNCIILVRRRLWKLRKKKDEILYLVGEIELNFLGVNIGKSVGFFVGIGLGKSEGFTKNKKLQVLS